MQKIEHYTVVRQPEGSYETHFTPSSGSGHSIGVELAAVVRYSYIFPSSGKCMRKFIDEGEGWAVQGFGL